MDDVKKNNIAQCVTVLIPCFNAENYLFEALQSIVNQSYKNLIILILDDGSYDDSLSIAQQFAATDCRVRIHRNIQNLGIIASRNKLLSLCETEFAAWMDADDIAAPLRIQKQLEFMQSHSEYLACTCHYTRIGQGKDKVITIPQSHVSREYLLFYNYVLNPGSMFRMSVCQQNDIQFRSWIAGASDYQFWVELARHGRIGVVPENLMTYRIHPAQETNAQKQRQLTGCLQIVKAQLLQFECHAKQEDLARLLIYPADILRLEYKLYYIKRNEEIIRTLLSAPNLEGFNTNLIQQLLFNMYRRQSWRVGVLGFLRFVQFYKFKGLSNSRHFGLTLLMQAIKQDWIRIVRIIVRDK